MTMIGLLAGTAPAAAAAPKADNGKTAAGFGSALKGAMNALSGEASSTSPEGTSPGDASTEEAAPAAPIELGALAESGQSAELIETQPMNDSGLPVGSTPLGDLVPPAGTGLPVELVETSPNGSALPGDEDANPGPGGIITAPGGTPQSDPALSEGVDGLLPAAGLHAGQVPGGSELSARVDGSTTTPVPATPLVGSVDTPPGDSSPSGDVDGLPPAAGLRPGGVAASSTSAPVSAIPLAGPVDVPPGSAGIAGDPAARPAIPEWRIAGGPTGSAIPGSGTTIAGGASVATGAAPIHESAPTHIPQPAAAPTSAPAPTGTAAPVAPPAPAAPAAPAPAASAPLGTQLSRPIFSLASAGAGEHVMTVSVTPDSLGPVTVRAHVGPEGVRVELFAPSDLGRDAIRAILPDLRRDLAGAGLGGNLNLSSQNEPSEQSNQGQSGPGDDGSARGGIRDAEPADSVGAEQEHEQRRPGRFGATSTIDVLA